MVTNEPPALIHDYHPNYIEFRQYSRNFYEQKLNMKNFGIIANGVIANELKQTTAGQKMAEITREEADAKIAASEARVDAKFARLDGKIDLLISKIDEFGDNNRETRDTVRDENRSTRANQWVVGLGLAALMVAIAALFPVFFGIGTSINGMVDHAVDLKTPHP